MPKIIKVKKSKIHLSSTEDKLLQITKSISKLKIIKNVHLTPSLTHSSSGGETPTEIEDLSNLMSDVNLEEKEYYILKKIINDWSHHAGIQDLYKCKERYLRYMEGINDWKTDFLIRNNIIKFIETINTSKTHFLDDLYLQQLAYNIDKDLWDIIN
jgi:hypothetical protein